MIDTPNEIINVVPFQSTQSIESLAWIKSVKLTFLSATNHSIIILYTTDTLSLFRIQWYLSAQQSESFLWNVATFFSKRFISSKCCRNSKYRKQCHLHFPIPIGSHIKEALKYRFLFKINEMPNTNIKPSFKMGAPQAPIISTIPFASTMLKIVLIMTHSYFLCVTKTIVCHWNQTFHKDFPLLSVVSLLFICLFVSFFFSSSFQHPRAGHHSAVTYGCCSSRKRAWTIPTCTCARWTVTRL